MDYITDRHRVTYNATHLPLLLLDQKPPVTHIPSLPPAHSFTPLISHTLLASVTRSTRRWWLDNAALRTPSHCTALLYRPHMPPLSPVNLQLLFVLLHLLPLDELLLASLYCGVDALHDH